MVDAQELVGIENEKPVGSGDQGLLLGMVERGGLRFLPLRYDVFAVDREVEFLQPLQHLDRSVGTIVCIDHDVREPDGKVMGDPFQEVGRLVLHHGDGHDGAVSGPGFEVLHVPVAWRYLPVLSLGGFDRLNTRRRAGGSGAGAAPRGIEPLGPAMPSACAYLGKMKGAGGHRRPSGSFCSAAVFARRKIRVTRVEVITMKSE
jgi:hypothetical protein